MESHEVTGIVEQVIALVEQHYLDADIGAQVSAALAAGLREGRYGTAERELAESVTADLQSVNGDKHLRLQYSDEPLAEREPGDDSEEYAAMARWAAETSSGIGRVERLDGNIGYLDIQPVLFPVTICGQAMTAAMTLLASTQALILDVRGCLGGEPAMVTWLCSYLFDHDPVQLSSLQERGRLTQSWTLPYVPGERYGAAKPVHVLTSATTFSGGEQLSYDLQQLDRATVIGEVTRGGAHAREGFRVHPHLEATISVAAAVNPVSGANWEGVGVSPDIEMPAGDALDHAHRLALDHLAAG
jgi:C-terminal processing protease CtpA/Prc